MGLLKPIIWKFVNPVSLVKIIRLQRNRKKIDRKRDDAQLKLYSQILVGDFLHYGYFDDPKKDPAEMSLNDLYRAQKRYAEIILEKVTNTTDEILDIGCGMGGLTKMMLEKGWKPSALTPDKTQMHYLREKYPDTPKYHCKLEEFPADENIQRYGTLITSESLQYLRLDEALPLMHKILKPGGIWIACDYFRIGDAHEKSGHNWDAFREKLGKYGWEMIDDRDITPNILPTISYVHMLGQRILLPFMNFGIEKFQVKAPGIHYACESAIPKIMDKTDKYMKIVDPEIFVKQKMYRLMVFRHKA
jgi:SAM-dependent methyltransferase